MTREVPRTTSCHFNKFPKAVVKFTTKSVKMFNPSVFGKAFIIAIGGFKKFFVSMLAAFGKISIIRSNHYDGCSFKINI